MRLGLDGQVQQQTAPQASSLFCQLLRPQSRWDRTLGVSLSRPQGKFPSLIHFQNPVIHSEKKTKISSS